MTTREVSGTLRRADGTPWAGVSIVALLARDTFTLDGEYPSGVVTAASTVTGEDGAWTMMLTSDLPVAYKLELPNGGHLHVVVPHDDGSPVTLAQLRQASTAPPSGASMADLIQDHEAAVDPHAMYMTKDETTAEIETLLITHHADLQGLDDDDHPHYLTQARADAVFATDADVAGKAPLVHTHPWSDVTGEPNFALQTALDSVNSAQAAHAANRANPHVVTLAQIGAAAAGHTHVGEPSAPHTHPWADVTGEPAFALDSELTATKNALSSHSSNTQNPHLVTTGQIGAAPLNHTHTASGIALPRVFPLAYLAGVLTVGNDKAQNIRLDANVTAIRVSAFAKVAPSGVGTTLDIKRSANQGGSWASMLSAPLTLGSGVKFIEVTTFPDPTLDGGDFFRVDVLTVPGVGSAPSDVTVQLDALTR
jgi:hypothetical protein